MVRNGQAKHIDSLIYYLGGVFDLLKREDVTDIEINSNGKYVFVDGARGREKTEVEVDRSSMLAFINKIASMKGSSITKEHPTLSAILPQELFNCRLEASIPPVTPAPGPNIVIRKPGMNFPITDYVDETCRKILIDQMKEKANILICGSTSSGKTSFLNSLLDELLKVGPHERLIILEDEHEVNCQFDNHDFLFTVKSEKQDMWSMADNVKKSLRKNPDRIIVGEVRGIEAKEVLTAWDTGHGGGFCTLHSGGARQGFMRFFRMADLSWNNPLDQMFAGEAVDLLVYLSKSSDGRKVREMVDVSFNYEPDVMKPEFTTIYPKP